MAKNAISQAKHTAGVVERREQIIQHAAELFDRMGYFPTSMDDIAQAVGLAKPSLYHYFRSKDSILLAIHDETITLLLERQSERELVADASPSDQIYDVMFDMVDLIRTHPGHVRVYFEHRRELPAESQVEAQSLRTRYFESIRRLFEQGHHRGEFHGDPNLSTIMLFSLCNHIYQWYGTRDGHYSTKETVTYFHSVLMNGVRGQAEIINPMGAQTSVKPTPIPSGSRKTA